MGDQQDSEHRRGCDEEGGSDHVDGADLGGPGDAGRQPEARDAPGDAWDDAEELNRGRRRDALDLAGDEKCHTAIVPRGDNMAILKVLTYPDPKLRLIAAPILEVDDEVRRLADDLAETMYFMRGAGLSASQVDVHRRIFVTDVVDGWHAADLRVFINPRIVSYDEKSCMRDEGCLNFPGVREPVRRPERVTVWALDLKRESFTLEAEGLLAVAVQHELEHLDGKLFLDRLSHFAQRRVERAMRKRRWPRQ